MSTTNTTTRTGNQSQSNSQPRRNRRAKKAPSQTSLAATTASTADTAETQSTVATVVESSLAEDDETASTTGAVCWICAEPVRYWAVSECNHRTCHVCALRLRVLYKKLECTFCKHAQNSVIFTASADQLFSSYTPDDTPFRDAKSGIYFETQEMMEDTLVLLRYNCPDDECTYFATGWGDLKAHVRTVHKKAMCDLCIRNKKIFAHEHTLYTTLELHAHLPSMNRRHGKDNADRVAEGAHPLCQFCDECFFGDDEFYVHMRDRHEKCFVCDREGRKFNYFRNYEELEQHFTNAHFPCTHPQCLAQKFVVFGSSIDLKAHSVEQHGGDMSSRDKRDARRVEVSFQQSGTDSFAPARGARRRNGFGASLTTSDAAAQPPAAPVRPVSQREEPSENLPAEIAERQTAFLSRFSAQSSLAVRAAIRSFRSSESPARDLISTLLNIYDLDIDATGSCINSVVELFDEEKRQDILRSWNSYKLEQRREFPELTPAAQGTEYSGIAAGRVLNAKHATGRGAANRRVWDRVAQAASSSSTAPTAPRPQPVERFPALQTSSTSAPTQFRSANITPWTSAASSAVRATISSTPQAPAPQQRRPPAARLNEANFPSLPPSSGPSHAQRTKGMIGGNKSMRNIAGPQPSSNAWGAGRAEADDSSAATAAPVEDTAPDTGTGTAGGKGKKKGKQKQTLFTLGSSFPT